MTDQERRLRYEQKARARKIEKASRKAAKGPLDVPFLMLSLILTGIGLVMLFSASFPSAYYESGNPAYYFLRQLGFGVLGIVLMFVVSRWNYARWRGLAVVSVGVAIILLAAVAFTPLGVTSNGATRWINLGIQFQPSEVAKVAVIIFFADRISRKKEKMLQFKEGILPFAAVLVVFSVLLMCEPHFSATVLICGIGCAMLFVGGMQLKWLAFAAGGAAFVAGLFFTGVITYNSSRIKIWRDPLNPEWMLDKGYQMRQSLISIGSGGLTGVGLGQSRQKHLFLPEEHNDFIFSVICEELGLIGATIIMLLFAFLIIRGYWIALHARDRFGSLLVIGVTTQIALQTALNIAVVSNLVPASGISLPFFSYGGTALVIQLIEIGIVLSVSRQTPTE